MRKLSFGIRSGADLSSIVGRNQSATHAAPQMQSWLRRRLEDAVEDVFRLAMQRGDLASAEDLLGVMESMHIRACLRFNAERRGTVVMLERARRELEARKAARRRLGR